ncbi:MAG TPA: hypothetical protein VF175_05600 [Lacipirellula sp.]
MTIGVNNASQGRRRLSAIAFAILATFHAAAAPAGVIASDVASNSAYVAQSGGAWKGLNPMSEENPAGSDDGGFGFKPWNFAGGFHYSQQSPYGRLNHFIDGVDFAASSFNNLGAPAFALTNANVVNGGATSIAARPFEAPLSVGATLSFRFDNPSLAPLHQFDEAGFVIRLNSGGGPLAQSGVEERFAIFASSNFLGGGWAAVDAGGESALGFPSSQTRSGAEFRFTLTGAESYRLDLLPLNDGAPLASKTGSLARPGTGAIDALEILMYGNGSGNGQTGAAAQRTGEREFFFNNLSITAPTDSGDYDADGDVDGRDLLIWQRTLGSTTNLGADGSRNGTVDAADLQVWKETLASPGAGAVAAAIPEPSFFALSAAAFAVSLRRARRICQIGS